MKTFENNRGWGKEIGWARLPNDEGVGKIAGWHTPRPENGDEFMASHIYEDGSRDVFALSDVEHCRDPRDMFFATATWKERRVMASADA